VTALGTTSLGGTAHIYPAGVANIKRRPKRIDAGQLLAACLAQVYWSCFDLAPSRIGTDRRRRKVFGRFARTVYTALPE
jgi:hypothetical protein